MCTVILIQPGTPFGRRHHCVLDQLCAARHRHGGGAVGTRAHTHALLQKLVRTLNAPKSAKYPQENTCLNTCGGQLCTEVLLQKLGRPVPFALKPTRETKHITKKA